MEAMHLNRNRYRASGERSHAVFKRADIVRLVAGHPDCVFFATGIARQLALPHNTSDQEAQDVFPLFGELCWRSR